LRLSSSISSFLTSAPAAISTVVTGGTARLAIQTIQTVPTYGHHPFPDWVSHLRLRALA
jgi:hypothetical protein